MSWVCSKCGHGNLDEWGKCANCGLKNHKDFKIDEKKNSKNLPV